MKPGYLTTEWWLTLAAVLIAGAMPLLPAGSPAAKIAAAALAVLGSLGYAALRTSLKRGNAAGDE